MKINKDRTVNKNYTRKLWNFVTDSIVKCINNEISDKELQDDIEKFQSMLNEISDKGLRE
jgi:hypothetical protein